MWDILVSLGQVRVPFSADAWWCHVTTSLRLALNAVPLRRLLQNPEVQLLALLPLLKEFHRTCFPLSLLFTPLESVTSSMPLHVPPWLVPVFVCNGQDAGFPPPTPAPSSLSGLVVDAASRFDPRSFLRFDPSCQLPRGLHPSPPRTSNHPTHHRPHIDRLWWKGAVKRCLRNTRTRVRWS